MSEERWTEANQYDREGVERIGRGDVAGALKYLDLAIQTDPTDAIFFLHRGQANCVFGRYDVALKDLETSLSLRSTPEAFYVRGVIVNKLGGSYTHMEDFERAVELAPGFADAIYSRGVIKLETGDPVGALEDFDLAWKAFDRAQDTGSPEPESTKGEFYVHSGIAHESLGNTEEAIRNYQRGFAILNTHINTHHVSCIKPESTGMLVKCIEGLERLDVPSPKESVGPIGMYNSIHRGVVGYWERERELYEVSFKQANGGQA